MKRIVKPVLVPTACASCGEVKEAREYRVCHKHHKDFKYVSDSWGSECRVCRRRSNARMIARLKASARRDEMKQVRQEEARVNKGVLKYEKTAEMVALQMAKSEYLKAVRVDKQQLKRMDRNEHPTKKTERARAVREAHIEFVKSRYERQVSDIKALREYKPLDLRRD